MITAIVTGSRDWPWEEEVYASLDESRCDCVVQGGCPTGADKYARRWADLNEVECITFEADWPRYGKRAGPIRNTEMLRAYMYDQDATVYAFRRDMSPGTTNTINTAKKFGMTVRIKES